MVIVFLFQRMLVLFSLERKEKLSNTYWEFSDSAFFLTLWWLCLVLWVDCYAAWAPEELSNVVKHRKSLSADYVVDIAQQSGSYLPSKSTCGTMK